jgi:hypothetical protein
MDSTVDGAGGAVWNDQRRIQSMVRITYEVVLVVVVTVNALVLVMGSTRCCVLMRVPLMLTCDNK